MVGFEKLAFVDLGGSGVGFLLLEFAGESLQVL